MEDKFKMIIPIQAVACAIQQHLMQIVKSKQYNQDEILLIANLSFNLTEAISDLMKSNSSKEFNHQELEDFILHHLNRIHPITIDIEFNGI